MKINSVKRIIATIFRLTGYEIRKLNPVKELSLSKGYGEIDLTEQDLEILDFVITNELSMCSPERLRATLMACKYAVVERIEGDFVECGVWRGGNALIAASIIQLYGSDKKVWLFDTFTGMTKPTDLDTSVHESVSAIDNYELHQNHTDGKWVYASLEEVRQNFIARGLLTANVKFIKGDIFLKLEDQTNIPKKISVLRLDTDWYESTKRELEILYPQVSSGGIIMVDDYGHWEGARKAVDEYFIEQKPRPFFQYIDYTGILGVKVSHVSKNKC
jgi:hypothetical protein